MCITEAPPPTQFEGHTKYEENAMSAALIVPLMKYLLCTRALTTCCCFCWWFQGAGRTVTGARTLFRPAAQASAVADWVTVPAVKVWYMGSLLTVMMSLKEFVRVAGRSCRRHP